MGPEIRLGTHFACPAKPVLAGGSLKTLSLGRFQWSGGIRGKDAKNRPEQNIRSQMVFGRGPGVWISQRFER